MRVPALPVGDEATEHRLAVALLIFTSALVYVNSLFSGFAFDDEFVIAGNARVHQLADQAAIWLTPYWPEFGAEAGLYRPLAIFAWAAQWAIGGGAPWVFHLGNVLLHTGVCVLLYFLSCRFLTARGALVGTLIFAVHPAHTEVVANVVGQAELIAAAAILGTCLLWLDRPPPTGDAGGGTPVASTARGRVTLLVVLYAAAMLAKESAIMLPGLLIALDVARRRVATEGARTYLRTAALPIAVLLVTSLLYLALRVQVLGSVTGGDAAPSLPFLRSDQRLFVALQTWPEYVRLLFWPFDLSADYSPDVLVPAAGVTPSVVLGAALLGLTLVLAGHTQVHPRAGLPAAWFVIAILPVSNLILPIGVVLAERLLYTPSVTVALVAGAVYERAAAVARTYRGVPVPAAVLVTVLAVFGLRTVLRNADWKDTPAYWNALIRDHPESYRAQWGVGAHMAANGELALARTYLMRAAETWPHDPDLLQSLGLLHLRQGEPVLAVAALERVHSMRPVGRPTALHLAEAYLVAGEPGEALSVLENESAPEHAVLVLRAQALEQLGKTDAAAAVWVASTHSGGDHVWQRWGMAARAFARAGERASASAATDSAALYAPDRAAIQVIRRLGLAVAKACYDTTPMRAGCEDPLDGWLLLPAARIFAFAGLERVAERGRPESHASPSGIGGRP